MRNKIKSILKSKIINKHLPKVIEDTSFMQPTTEEEVKKYSSPYHRLVGRHHIYANRLLKTYEDKLVNNSKEFVTTLNKIDKIYKNKNMSYEQKRNLVKPLKLKTIRLLNKNKEISKKYNKHMMSDNTNLYSTLGRKAVSAGALASAYKFAFAPAVKHYTPSIKNAVGNIVDNVKEYF